jgi:subtilase-type serine protease
MRDVLNGLLTLDAYQARNAFDQMGGYIHTAVPNATFQAFNQYRGMLVARMAGFMSGVPSALAARPVMYASRTVTGNDAKNTLLAAAAGPARASGAGGGTKTPAWGFWVDTYGSLGERRANDISSKYDYNTAGAIVGFDKKLSPDLLLGASIGYSYTRIDLKDLSEDARMSSYQGALYGIYTKGPIYVNGVAGYAYNTYDTTRSMAFGTIARQATANYSGHFLAGYLEGGYKIRAKYADVIPLASFQATHLKRNSFSEDGAGSLSLDANSIGVSSFLSSVGVRLTKEFRTQSGVFAPDLKLTWDHEFSNDKHALNAAFTGYPQSAFTVTADSPDKDRLSVAAGLTWKVKETVHLNITYGGTFFHDTTQHAGMLGIQFTF